METLTTQVAAARAALRPVSPKVLAVMLDKTLALFETPGNWDEIASSYTEAFQDVPEDLAAAAMKWVRLNSKWMPKPAEFRMPIAEELAGRHVALKRLQLAERHWKPVEPEADRGEITPEMQATLDRILGSVRGRPMPGEGDGQ